MNPSQGMIELPMDISVCSLRARARDAMERGYGKHFVAWGLELGMQTEFIAAGKLFSVHIYHIASGQDYNRYIRQRFTCPKRYNIMQVKARQDGCETNGPR